MEKHQVMLPTASTSLIPLSSHFKHVQKERSLVDVVYEGYQWRKYGKKIVKNNSFPSVYPVHPQPTCKS
ncbi:probable WRKY transcription factor 45 [Phaseolus vulgaris]|uniref:probable WRKY transcription factor 45 n=1 Tax=Phaseolus vulgaris TaxID=3885 RepID=UPI0035CC8A5D